MNISQNLCVGNSSKLFAASGTNQSNYLESDYFLSASQRASYYSRKYSSKTSYHNLNFKSKSSKISRIVSASLLSAMMLTATLDAKAHPSVESEEVTVQLDRVLDGDSAYDILSDDTMPSILSPSSKNQGIKTEIGGVNMIIPNHFFESDQEDTSSLSNFSENDAEWDDDEKGNQWNEQAIEDVATRVTTEFSNDTTNTEPVNTFTGSGTTKSSTPMPTQELPKIVGYQYKEPLIPNNHYRAKPSSAEILSELAVKDEMHKTLSRRKAAMEIEEDEEIDDALEAGAINSKEKEADATYSKLSASEEARQTIARNKSAIAENRALLEAKYATIAKSRLGLAYKDPDAEIGDAFASEFESKNNEQVIDNDDAALTLPPPPTEAELALMDTGIIPNSNDIDTTTPQGQSSYSENYNQMSSSSSEYDTDAEIRSYENMPVKSRNKRYIKKRGSSYSYRDIDQGLANLKGDDLPFPPPPTAEELVELTNESELDTLTKSDLIAGVLVGEEEQQADADLTNSANINNSVQEVSEDEEDTSNSFDTDETDISNTELTASINGADAQVSNISQEDLLKKVATAVASHAQAREVNKISSKQIRHRMFVRDMVTAAVAAGDEDVDEALDDAAEKTHGYSIWSSGTLGSNKQKSKADLNGYSTKIAGGTIGLELNLEKDLLLGASFGKFSSRVKYQDQGASSDLRSSTASNRAKYDTHIFSLYGLSPVSRNMSISLIGSAGLSKGTKARSKLLSFEPHLNYRVELPRAVTLIPYIGLRYEYEKASRHKEQIASSLSIERSKKSYQALNGEIGSRVIFAPIKLNGSTPRAISITPTAHFSVERRIGSRGRSHPFTLTYYESQQTIGTGIVSVNAQNERTSLNAGIGLIASRKNIKLELLYDQQRQKRFKSHQGVLKLKVSL